MKPSDFRFRLRSWETRSAFDSVPHAWTRALWRGRERNFTLALVDGFLRFCDLDDSRPWDEAGEWNFVAGAPLFLEQRELDGGAARQRFSLDWLRGKFLTALRRDDVGRLLAAGESRDWLLLRSDGRGEIHSPPKTETTCFDFGATNDFWGCSSSFWREAFAREEPHIVGDFAVARDWHRDTSSRRWMITRMARGSRAEFERVGSWLIRAHPERLAQARDEEFERVSLSFTWSLSPQMSWIFDDYNYEIGDRLTATEERLCRVFFEWFGLQHDEETARAHACSRGMADGGHATWTINADNDEPSAHEQLETRLQLRHWLRERAGLSDEHIAQLLN